MAQALLTPLSFSLSDLLAGKHPTTVKSNYSWSCPSAAVCGWRKKKTSLHCVDRYHFKCMLTNLIWALSTHNNSTALPQALKFTIHTFSFLSKHVNLFHPTLRILHQISLKTVFARKSASYLPLTKFSHLPVLVLS